MKTPNLMKQYKTVIKSILFVVAIVLLQSCKVYQKNNVGIEQAVMFEKDVKIKTIHSETKKFDKLVKEGDGYFGINDKFGKTIKTPINEKEIRSIQLYDKSGSTGATILGILGGVLLLFTGILVVSF